MMKTREAILTKSEEFKNAETSEYVWAGNEIYWTLIWIAENQIGMFSEIGVHDQLDKMERSKVPTEVEAARFIAKFIWS